MKNLLTPDGWMPFLRLLRILGVPTMADSPEDAYDWQDQQIMLMTGALPSEV